MLRLVLRVGLSVTTSDSLGIVRSCVRAGRYFPLGMPWTAYDTSAFSANRAAHDDAGGSDRRGPTHRDRCTTTWQTERRNRRLRIGRSMRGPSMMSDRSEASLGRDDGSDHSLDTSSKELATKRSPFTLPSTLAWLATWHIPVGA